MKLILLLLLFPIVGRAQSNDSLANIRFQVTHLYQAVSDQNNKMQAAGDELNKFYKVYNTGTALEVVGLAGGAITAVVGYATDDANLTKELAITSAAIGLAGWIVQLTAHKHIKNAGIALSSNGVNIPIR